jgi:hypothetical protein
MTTDNSRTQISEPSPSNVEKRNSSKDQRVLEKSLDVLESIQMDDEIENVLTDDNIQFSDKLRGR